MTKNDEINEKTSLCSMYRANIETAMMIYRDRVMTGTPSETWAYPDNLRSQAHNFIMDNLSKLTELAQGVKVKS